MACHRFIKCLSTNIKTPDNGIKRDQVTQMDIDWAHSNEVCRQDLELSPQGSRAVGGRLKITWKRTLEKEI